MPPDGASLLLESTPNIAEAIQMLSPLLSSWAPNFVEAIKWLQFTYTETGQGTTWRLHPRSLFSTRCRKEVIYSCDIE